MVETPLEKIPFLEVQDQHDSADQWMICRRTESLFEGFCAPARFEDMLKTFLDWAESQLMQ